MPGVGRGINDGGVTTFSASGDIALFRECVQNSLDATISPDSPAYVEMVVIDMPTSWIDGKGLAEALQRCVESRYNNDDGREQFREAAKLLSQETIRTLQITDSGTNGASDDLDIDQPVSEWDGLTMTTGYSANKGGSSVGSYGLGKHAAFAATPLRSVLYATCYQEDPPEQRFIGRSILVTHYDDNDNQLSHDGYLGDKTDSVKNGSIPEWFRMPDRGTRVLVPGWGTGREGGEWKIEALEVVVTNYFWAILNNHLNVVLGDNNDLCLDKDALLSGGEARNALEDKRAERHWGIEKTLRYIDLSIKKPNAVEYFPGVGDVELRVGVGIEGGGRRDIALVREPGLFITDVAANLSRDLNPVIPRHWKDFTAVVVVKPRPAREGKDEDWVVRDCESPAHNALDVGRIRETRKINTRSDARRALRQVRDWLKKEIEKYANPGRDSIDDWGDLGLIEKGLFVETDEGGNMGGKHGGIRGGRSVRLGDVRVRRHLPRQSLPGFEAAPKKTTVDDPDGVEEPDEKRLPEGEGNGPGPPNPDDRELPPNAPATSKSITKTVPRIELQPVFTPVPAGKGSQRDTHAFRVALTIPKSIKGKAVHVRVRAVGEDTRLHPIRLMYAEHNAKRLDIADQRQGVIAIPASLTAHASNLDLEIRANEPISDTAFDVTVVAADTADSP